MSTYKLIRSTLAATICLSVLAACDGRGVTAMKSRMYTPEERAQAKLMAQKTGSTAAPDKSVAATTEKIADSEPQIDPLDHAQMKNYFEPSKTDSSGTQATMNVAILKKIVEQQLGTDNEAAGTRVLGISIDNVSTGGKSIINVRAVVNFRNREQLLHLENLVIDTAAKDVVSGTSKVALAFKNQSIDDKVENVTVKDLVVASMCLEAKGELCTSAYLMFQFSRPDGWVDVAVFKLDADMAIIDSNIGDWTKKTYEIAEAKVTAPAPAAPAAPAPATTATIETVRRHQNIELMNQTMGVNNPFAKVEAPAKAAVATVAPAAKPATTTAPAKTDVAPTAKQLTRQTMGLPNDPFASVGTAATTAPATAGAKATPAATAVPFGPVKRLWNWMTGGSKPAS